MTRTRLAHRSSLLLLFAAVVGAFAACSPSQTPTPAATASPVATPTGEPTAQPTPAHGPTRAAEPTPLVKSSWKPFVPASPPPGYDNWILYREPTNGSSDATFWLVKDDGGGNHQIAKGRVAHWNKNGSGVEVVAVDSKCLPSLSVYSTGGGMAKVPMAFVAGDTGFQWSRDGLHLLFYRHAGTFKCNSTAVATNVDLYAVNTDGTGLTKLVAGLAGTEPVSWMPDGSAVILVNVGLKARSGPLVRVNVADKSVHQILAAGTYLSPSVSADGKWLAYAKLEGFQRRMHVTDNLGTDAANASHLDYDLNQLYAQDLYGVWGSDARHFLVVRSHPDDQLGPGTWNEYYLYDVTKSTPSWGLYTGALVSSVAGGNVDWNPDGSLIAASTVSNFGQGKIPLSKILVLDPATKGGIFLDGTDGVNFLSWQPLG